MKTIEISEAAASLVEHARGAGKQPLVLTLDGQPVAALVGLDNLDLETLALSNNPEFLSLIEKARRRYKAEGGVPSDELRRRLKKSRDSAPR
ncbi:MAG TPA: hypothetical protein VNH11_18960 [Pirellulales bacterium]|nr:hypothetical protein [Pirellulales bacterium]